MRALQHDTGRTSSVSHEIMGFSSTGEVCNYAQAHRISWADVCEASSKVGFGNTLLLLTQVRFLLTPS